QEMSGVARLKTAVTIPSTQTTARPGSRSVSTGAYYPVAAAAGRRIYGDGPASLPSQPAVDGALVADELVGREVHRQLARGAFGAVGGVDQVVADVDAQVAAQA